MKRSFLSRLQRNGVYYLISALILLLGVPLYQFLFLAPQGYSNAIAATNGGRLAPYVQWVGTHLAIFVGYRLLLIIAFALLLSLPFTLFRIIVAQEILGREEEEEEAPAAEVQEEREEGEETGESSLPPFAWRGKGFAVIAAWAGLFGIILFVLGTLASTIYVALVASSSIGSAAPPANFASLAGFFAIVGNTVGGGLLALAALFFGAIIARSGLKLWPPAWVAFGYVAIVLAVLFSGSAVGVASSPTAGQALLTTPAVLLFAVWTLWFGIMLVRLKPEP